jgi:sigma-B regulation protein RsbU (phosphoserine phosphatase)
MVSTVSNPAGGWGKGLRGFYARVTEGMAMGELWAQFKADTRSGYDFYARDVDWDSFKDLPGWKRFLKVAWAFFLAMLMHLSPVRRVILLVSLCLVVLGIPNVTVQPSSAGPGWRMTAENSALTLYGALGLFLLLALELADRVVMKRDLQIAREIQHWLVPAKPPVVPGLDIAFTTRPANTVGGDFYDVIVQKSETGAAGEKVLLVVADVAGKSVPAALLMATFQASLHALTGAASSLSDLVSRMNRSACTRSMGGQRFTTAFFAELALPTGRLVFINAGHNYPFLRRSDGSVEVLTAGGVPLGIQAEAEYVCGERVMEEGDLLLVYTDGLVEAVDSRDQEFGEERLRSLVETAGTVSAGEFLETVRLAVDRHVGEVRQYDDMTWLVVRRLGPAA